MKPKIISSESEILQPKTTFDSEILYHVCLTIGLKSSNEGMAPFRPIFGSQMATKMERYLPKTQERDTCRLFFHNKQKSRTPSI